ncbi:MAG TPA: dTMP kinase [Candidatus Hydrogenedentes bacterium]|jgi:dTMP kinase|nr:MAG: Thymidylate kinase [Candidatus Hydrogenedentes bacterium ADurb.Bin170]HNZ48292.1 dTMP kinase [Candidatus Hydrogenedentota bacterium]HOD94572.1 dTMP kinase [Candidatus Hydrogenedentota bacterium]HOM48660.1 dTMP kinase [Candidatus Hydrogenedentota bacterium]HOR51440.1 dTMP kinase [Candidatus Hydrogenedentota bacterium]
MTGLFITLEGGEGSGKSTQIGLLSQWLRQQGYEVLATREPGGTPLAEEIRTLLMVPRSEKMSSLAELFLYQAARAQHVQEVIRPALLRGAVVLCDRFTDSTRAYQGAGRTLPDETVVQLNQLAAQDIQPDITFILDLPEEAGMQRARDRGSDDRMMTEALAFHRNIRAAFQRLAKEEPDRITMVDGTLSREAVLAVLQERILPRLPARPMPEKRS